MSRMQGSPEVLNNFPLRTQSEEVSKCISVAQILVLLLSTGDLWMKPLHVGTSPIPNLQKSSHILPRSAVLVKLIDMSY